MNDDFISKVTAHIRANLDNDLSLQSVASAFSISQSHLSRVFKDGEGVSFQNYAVAAKFERASEMLMENQDQTITRVAKSLGYHDLAYFSKLFKGYYGMTPSQYRKWHSQKDMPEPYKMVT